MAEPPAHLVSAAAAYERILNSKYPGQGWIVTVRDDRDKPREPDQKPAEAAPTHTKEG